MMRADDRKQGINKCRPYVDMSIVRQRRREANHKWIWRDPNTYSFKKKLQRKEHLRILKGQYNCLNLFYYCC